jgi:threonine dehydrogenase-like Zn-dependent dehydrogenase
MSDRQVRGVRLRYAVTARNHAAIAVLGPRLPRLARGWMPWLELTASEPMDLPGPDWVRIRPRLSGICGTDLALLTGRASAVLTPFSSFPAVMGHEVVGDVVEAGGSAAGAWNAGDRVVVDPAISCAMRALRPCAACRRGVPALCERQAEGRLGPGILMGFTAGLPGAWGDEIIAHVSQLYRVPDAIPDDVAVLVEPMSVALHGVLGAGIEPGQRVLVIGAGSIGLLAVASLTLLATGATVTVLARHRAQRTLAERLGAGNVIGEAGGRKTDARLAEAAGSRLHRPVSGRDVSVGGFDVVLDCVGSASSLDLAFRHARAGGRVVVLGGPGVLANLDWTLVWIRELLIAGSFVYGREHAQPGEPHTFDLALRLLAEHPELPVADLVTHRYPLSEWREAIRTSLARRRGAGKVAFTFPEEPG